MTARSDLIYKQMENERRSRIPVAGQHGAGAERRYSQLYQELVKLGAEPQIKLKYR